MFYEIQCFYHRDVYFVYSEENEVPHVQAIKGNVKENGIYVYRVDKIDKKIGFYDILPTIGPFLVSKGFADTFSHLISNDIKLFKAVIVDNEGNSNNDFYMMIILNHLSCMDDIKSVVEEKVFRDGSKSIRIKKLSINADKTDNKSVFLVKEKTSYSIVNEDFKNRGNKLNGLNFLKIS
ncbi:hypothetical protein CRV00_06315 [Malaciobacter molluscorum]|uniref:imm11 family protein n=1 Tax=Malaciobacter molluscorum TaxID=1032072 RepID=UPI00100A55BA|nr:DUF1629 domain-containing protein [Malaciobacter molluscorum]RXJ94537.1 hypothetical protein CRV00_06315 [Malaciobacter molluscorum]